MSTITPITKSTDATVVFNPTLNPADVPLDEKLLWTEIPDEAMIEILDNLALQKTLGYYE